MARWIMPEKIARCPKCKQTPPPEARFCPHCGINLSGPVAKDYTQVSYTELVLEAKRIEVAILKDERTIDQLQKKIQDGSFKLNSRKKITGLGRAEIVETIKKDILGYQWDTGGYVHPMLGDLVRIKEELIRRERVDEHQHLEKFIKNMQGKN